jgi:hypothetical protein
MTRSILVSLLPIVLLSLLTAAPVQAETRKIASVSQSQLKSACDKAGGLFSPSEGTSSYDCIKENCDGKGGTCSVSCTSGGSCEGTTPTTLVGPQTLLSLIQNGDLVYREPSQMPTGSLTGGGGGGVAPAPVASAGGGDPEPPPPECCDIY